MRYRFLFSDRMSFLLIRSSMKPGYLHQVVSLWRDSKRTISIVHSNQQKIDNNVTKSSIVSSNNNADISTDVKPIGERIKENTKTAGFFGVIVFGAVVTGAMFFAIFRELISSNSPNNIYSDALKVCTNVSLI